MTTPDPVACSRALLIATRASADPVIAAVPSAAGSRDEMTGVLTDPALCGWPATSVTSAETGDARYLMRVLRRLAGEAEETLLVYFAGPGILRSHGDLCLGLPGTRLDDVEETSLPYERVRRAVLSSRARLKIVILDCSYSGRVIPSLPAIPVAELTGINATYVLTANDREADPGDADAAAFTADLVATIRAGIAGGPPALTLSDLYDPLADRLRRGGRPLPNRETTGLAGQLPFTRNAVYGPPPEMPDAPVGQGGAEHRGPAPGRRRVIALAGGVLALAGVGGVTAAVESRSRPHETPPPRTTRAGAFSLAGLSPTTLVGSGDHVNGIAFTLDGRYLIGGSGTTNVRPRVSLQLWDLRRPSRPAVSLEHGPSVHGVALHPDRRHFATASDGGAVHLWDLATRRSRLICTHEHNAWNVAFSPDGAILASSSSDWAGRGHGRTVILSAVSTGGRLAVLSHPDSVGPLAFAPADESPDGSKTLVTGCNDNLVRVWDIPGGQQGPPPPRILRGHASPVACLAFRPHGGGMFATGGWNGDPTVRLWNLASASSGTVLGRGVFPHTVTGVAFSPDGQTLVAACTDYLYFWDLRGASPKLGLTRNSSDTFAVTYDATGERLASTSGGAVLLWGA